jgi:hypothetical protein
MVMSVRLPVPSQFDLSVTGRGVRGTSPPTEDHGWVQPNVSKCSLGRARLPGLLDLISPQFELQLV